MGPMSPNIVQAEFFHVGGKEGQSLEDMMSEAGERIHVAVSAILEGVPPSMAGARIKTTVRFFDEDGSLTRYVGASEKLESRYNELLMGFPEDASGLRGMWHRLRFISLAGRKMRHEKMRHTVTFRALEAAVRGRQPVALEDWEHCFRPLERNEEHELLEAVRSSRNLMLFLFRPNNLLSDTQVGMGSAI